jgi:hypothetical protein
MGPPRAFIPEAAVVRVCTPREALAAIWDTLGTGRKLLVAEQRKPNRNNLVASLDVVVVIGEKSRKSARVV